MNLSPEAVVAFGITILFWAGCATIVAVQARWRGYRFVPWFFASLLGNPVFIVVLLAILPDRARRALRQQFRADLQAKLRARPVFVTPLGPAICPAEAPSTLSPDASVGDLRTIAPPLRSLGDDETRG